MCLLKEQGYTMCGYWSLKQMLKLKVHLLFYFYIKTKTHSLTDHEISGTTKRIVMKLIIQLDAH